MKRAFTDIDLQNLRRRFDRLQGMDGKTSVPVRILKRDEVLENPKGDNPKVDGHSASVDSSGVDQVDDAQLNDNHSKFSSAKVHTTPLVDEVILIMVCRILVATYLVV